MARRNGTGGPVDEASLTSKEINLKQEIEKLNQQNENLKQEI